jgi:hypothetical protein
MITDPQPTTISIPGTTYTDEAFEAFDIDFAQGEQADKPITEEARLWWFNGLPTDTDLMAIGWHIKAGINPSLDETMEGMGVRQYLVQHKRPDKDGKTEPKPYWRLREASLIVVTQRLQSSLEMNRNLQDRVGLAYAWEPLYDEQGKPLFNKRGKHKRQTLLKMRVFVHELVQHGYSEWFPVTLSGYSTDSVFEALTEQYRVLECYSAYRRAQGKNAIAPFYLFSLPTAPGAMKMVGEPPDQGSIYPIAARVPEAIDKTYLKSHLIPTHLIERIREHLLDEAIVWSIEESIRIDQGRTGQDERPVLHESSQEAGAETHVLEADPLVQQPQVIWIVRQYCKEDQAIMNKVCQHFGVSRLEDLRMSHFRALVGQLQAVQKNGRPNGHQ